MSEQTTPISAAPVAHEATAQAFPATPDAFAQLSEAQTRAQLITAIASLPEREQMVIQLYHVEELNLEEIGQVLGVGAARVCQIKAQAHARLKKAMTRG